MTDLLTNLSGGTTGALREREPSLLPELPQLISLLKVDLGLLATGYRVTGVVGRAVVDDAGEVVGRLEDLIISPNGEIFFAVLAIGGCLGIGARRITVRYSALEMGEAIRSSKYYLLSRWFLRLRRRHRGPVPPGERHDRQVVFRGATAEILEDLPDVLPNAGIRTSRVIGAPVVNGADEAVGTVQDFIIAPDETVLFVVLAVGGFLGMGVKHVIAPYGALVVDEEQVLFAHATKESVRRLPEFNYSV